MNNDGWKYSILQQKKKKTAIVVNRQLINQTKQTNPISKKWWVTDVVSQ